MIVRAAGGVVVIADRGAGLMPAVLGCARSRRDRCRRHDRRRVRRRRAAPSAVAWSCAASVAIPAGAAVCGYAAPSCPSMPAAISSCAWLVVPSAAGHVIVSVMVACARGEIRRQRGSGTDRCPAGDAGEAADEQRGDGDRREDVRSRRDERGRCGLSSVISFLVSGRGGCPSAAQVRCARALRRRSPRRRARSRRARARPTVAPARLARIIARAARVERGGRCPRARPPRAPSRPGP